VPEVLRGEPVRPAEHIAGGVFSITSHWLLRGIGFRARDCVADGGRALITEVPGLCTGRTISIDATTLEANAALKSIVRRDNGQSYHEYLKELAQAEGIENPTREQLARLDRKRKKKGSNREWMSPRDPDARITKMKDGRTHLAHKAEHAVDLTSGALVAMTLQAASEGDTSTILKTLAEAQVAALAVNEQAVEEVVADKGYHSGAVLTELHEQEVRSYIPEPERGRRKWDGEGKAEEQKRTYENRRRLRGDRNKRLQKLRSELTERSFAHLYETGGMRRVYLRGRNNILKRLLVQGAAFNLSLILRKTLGVGKPRRLQGLSGPLVRLFIRLFSWLWTRLAQTEAGSFDFAAQSGLSDPGDPRSFGTIQVTPLRLAASKRLTSTTGC